MNCKSRIILVVTLVLGCHFIVDAQPSDSTWSKSIGGENYDETSCIAIDQNGNVYSTGNFQSASISIENIQVVNKSTTGSDFFIAKYSSTGNLIWVKNFGGANADNAHSIAIDIQGNLVIIGEFYSPKIVLETIELTNSGRAGSPEIFVAKFNPNGEIIWAKNAKGSGFDEGRGITTDIMGNILCTGWFQSSKIVFDKTTLTNKGLRDGYVVKYSPNGDILWAQGVGSENSESCVAISTDRNSNVYIAGDFRSPRLTIGHVVLLNTNKDNSDAFMAKFDAQGKILWAKTIGGTLGDAATTITTDPQGNVVVAGFFSSSVIRFKNITFANQGNYDVFIAKYDSLGSFLWAKSCGGDELDNINSITTDSEGNIYCLGGFGSRTISFGEISLTGSPAASYVHNDIFIAKYSPVGAVLWANKFGGGVFDDGSCIMIDSQNNIYISGRFNSPTINFTDTTITTKGEHDGFIAKIQNQSPKK